MVAVAEVAVLKKGLAEKGHAKVIEHELDMRRSKSTFATGSSRIGRFVRKLIARPYIKGTPMRSVDCDLEEHWPSGNRQF
jgi:hypothetical protein